MFLLPIFGGVNFINPWSKIAGVSSKGDANRTQKLIHSSNEILRTISSGRNAWFALKNDNLISQIRGHNEIMFNNECAFFRIDDKTFDDFRGNDTLF